MKGKYGTSALLGALVLLAMGTACAEGDAFPEERFSEGDGDIASVSSALSTGGSAVWTQMTPETNPTRRQALPWCTTRCGSG